MFGVASLALVEIIYFGEDVSVDSILVDVNRQLCAIAADEMFDSWSPETQEQMLAEWNEWQNDEPEMKESKFCCNDCGRQFTRSNDLKRHVRINVSNVVKILRPVKR